VYDLKYSGIFAVAAFVLSLLIGLLSRSTMPMLIIRPLIFAAIFFALAAFIKILISRHLPELLENAASDDDALKPGSRINILEDEIPADSSALAEGFISGALSQASAGAKPDDSEDDLGDISELSKRSALYSAAEGSLTGIDQNAKEEYTDKGGLVDSVEPDFSNLFGTEASASSQERAAGTAANTSVKASAKKGGGANSDEDLPDLDSMAEAFTSESSGQGSEASEYSGADFLKKPSSDKAPKWTEDFDAKEIAMGLRTVLKKDKEG